MEYQRRWLIYCDAIGKELDDQSIKNYEFIAWINRHAAAYKAQKQATFIADQANFTEWLIDKA